MATEWDTLAGFLDTYTSDIDEVQDLLLAGAQAFAQSPEWRRKVIEDSEAWGVQSVSAEAIILRLVVKVRPGEQWAAQRAPHRTLKESLDRQHVDIPPLNRMVVDNRDSVRFAKLSADTDD